MMKAECPRLTRPAMPVVMFSPMTAIMVMTVKLTKVSQFRFRVALSTTGSTASRTRRTASAVHCSPDPIMARSLA